MAGPSRPTYFESSTTSMPFTLAIPLTGTNVSTILPWAFGRMPAKVRSSGKPISAGLLENIEIPQKSDAVTIDVNETAAQPADAGVMQSVVCFAELQVHPVTPLGHRHGIRKISPTARWRRVQCRTRWSCPSSEPGWWSGPGHFPPGNKNRLSRVARRNLPRGGPAGSNSHRPDLPRAHRKQFDAAQHCGAPHAGKVKVQQAIFAR